MSHFITRPVNAADLDERAADLGLTSAVDIQRSGELWMHSKTPVGKTELAKRFVDSAERAANLGCINPAAADSIGKVINIANTGPRIPRPAHAARLAASISAARQAQNDRLTQAERDHAKQLDSAFQLGRECGQREEGRTSWRWGVICGMPVGAALVVVALVLGAGSI